MKFTRRNFTKLLALSLVAPQQLLAGDEESGLLRPPGAVREDDFLARCNRCQKCVQVCPTRVIVPASFRFGVLRANTPLVSYKDSYCNSCLKCSLVCPTGALRPVTEDTLDIGIACIVKKNCVAWDWDGCTVCVDNCPLEAIELDEQNRPLIEPEKCNGCGICQVKCPSPSLRTSIQSKGIVIIPRPDGTPKRDTNA